MLTEVAILKMILCKKLNLNPDSLNCFQKFKQMKIVDNIKTFINETQYSLLDSPFCFDISFETRNLEDEKLEWKAYFCEENKENNKINLKSIFMKNRAGSVQIKLNVPPPNIDKFNVESLTSNGCFVGLECILKDHVLHEVRYYFEVQRADSGGLSEVQLNTIRNRAVSTTKSMTKIAQGDSGVELIRKIVKRSEFETPYNFTVESELNYNNNLQTLESSLLDDSECSENVEYYGTGSFKDSRSRF